jgi:hypothetical protein
MKRNLSLKTGILAIVILLFAGSSIFAQHHPDGRRRGGEPVPPPPIPDKQEVVRMVDELANELSLTAEQKEKVLKLFEEHFKTVKEKFAPPKKEEMDSLRKKFDESVKALLNKKQAKKYEEFLKSHKPQPCPPRPPRGREE